MRRSPLRSSSGLRRGGELKRRARLVAGRSERAETYEAEFRDARRAVLERAGGRCEGKVNERCAGLAAHVHHIRRRSQGGGNEVGNLVALCLPCHEWVHANPAAAAQAGLLARKGAA